MSCPAACRAPGLRPLFAVASVVYAGARSLVLCLTRYVVRTHGFVNQRGHTGALLHRGIVDEMQLRQRMQANALAQFASQEAAASLKTRFDFRALLFAFQGGEE